MRGVLLRRCDCDLDGLSVPDSVKESMQRMGGPDSVLKKLPPDEHIAREVDFYKAISDAKRLKILHILALTESCPCVLKQMMGMADSKLSYHLSKLEENGLVESYREQNWRVYRITELGRSSLI